MKFTPYALSLQLAALRAELEGFDGAVRHVSHRVSRTDRLGRPLRWDGKPYGKTTITAEDRAALSHVESPKRPLWFQTGSMA